MKICFLTIAGILGILHSVLSQTIKGASYNQDMVIMNNTDVNWTFGGYNSGSNYWMQATYGGNNDLLRGFRVLDRANQLVVFSTNQYQTLFPYGNLGIGTFNTEGTKLTINAPSEADRALRLEVGRFSMGGTGEFDVDAPNIVGGRFKILSNGWAGFGNNNPGANLDVKGGNAVIRATGNGIVGFSSFSTTAGSQDWRVESNRTITGTLNISNCSDNCTPRMIIWPSGSVGIGIDSPGRYKLNVGGAVRASEIVVNTNGADFVFENDYSLKPLSEVEAYVKENKHLPEIPAASEMQSEGMNVGELQTKLLQKIEELTLYMIEQNAKSEKLEKENKELQERIKKLESK